MVMAKIDRISRQTAKKQLKNGIAWIVTNISQVIGYSDDRHVSMDFEIIAIKFRFPSTMCPIPFSMVV
jgi:hypothetical protein